VICACTPSGVSSGIRNLVFILCGATLPITTTQNQNRGIPSRFFHPKYQHISNSLILIDPCSSSKRNNMGKAKKTRKFAVAKKMISPKDTRVRENLEAAKKKEELRKKKAEPRQVEQANSALFFQYNTQLGPPYHVLVDTNFINFSIRYVMTF
jgi:hypothetical protein